MTKSNENMIRETKFENRRLTPLGIELMTLSDLRAKVSAEVLARPERLDLYLLLFVTSGQGSHTVDFVSWPLSAGTLIFVRPGQVHQWHVEEAFSAHLVLIDPAALPNHQSHAKTRDGELLALLEWQTCTRFPSRMSLDIAQSIQRLQRDIAAFDESDIYISLIRHEMLALLFRLARWQSILVESNNASQRSLKTYRSFLQELEAGFRQYHSLKYYAAKLGYAESTISRACLSAEGRSAKSVIDRRITLEGQRMLAHSLSSIAEISHYLGFSEPTNFVKFFRRNTKTTPNEFRKEKTWR